MTLYRQLIIFTFVLFLLLFSGTWFAKLESTRTFLIDQLESHAQDTATSLSLSISPHVARNDMATVEGMLNAVFDRGYYQVVKFNDPRQKPLLERMLPVRIENVPSWFVNWLPLKTPEATADVMAGWKQAGTVYVKSHPGYAYETLWKDVVNMTLWFAACAFFVLLAGGFGLRMLLRPLVAVERQADALCRKEYRIQVPLPWTREFRRVVEAMNRMTSKVKEMFDEQAAQAESLQERAYHDPLTGLGNRRYFESRISASLSEHEEGGSGVVLLFRVHELEKLNQLKGYQAGDDLIKRVALLLKNYSTEFPDAAPSRLSGGDFALFIPNASHWDGAQLAEDLSMKIARIAAEQIACSDHIGNIGVATYSGVATMGRLLSEADMALGEAMQKGPNCCAVRAVTEESERMPLGQHQWKDILLQAVQARRITLFAQPVKGSTADSPLLHVELFSRIVQEDGTLLNAAFFMPLAERLNLVSAIDRIVIEEAVTIDYAALGTGRVAINLSPSSLADPSFSQWLRSFIGALPEAAPRFLFEFSEYSALQHLELVKEFSIAARAAGHGVGLDHYGQSFSRLGYLQSLQPEYVKIDRAYTGELKNELSDSRFYIGSLCSVAHSIDIAVVAEGVESEQQALILRELNVDGLQGYFTGRPEPVVLKNPGLG